MPSPGSAVTLLAISADVDAFVGEASWGAQVLNWATGATMAEAIDRRVVTQSMLNVGSSWAKVEDAIDVWVERASDGLLKLQDRC